MEDTKSDFTRDTEATGYRIHNLVSPYRQEHIDISHIFIRHNVQLEEVTIIPFVEILVMVTQGLCRLT